MNLIYSKITNTQVKKTYDGFLNSIILENGFSYIPSDKTIATQENVGKNIVVFYENGRKIERIEK